MSMIVIENAPKDAEARGVCAPDRPNDYRDEIISMQRQALEIQRQSLEITRLVIEELHRRKAALPKIVPLKE